MLANRTNHPDPFSCPQTFVVVCLDGPELRLASRRVFRCRNDARDYAATIAEVRHPQIIEGRWHALMLPTVPATEKE